MKCPGQDRRYWTGEPTFELPCPKCGTVVELFRDEMSGRCPQCGHRFPNPKAAMGCARWCPQARECVGLVPLDTAPAARADASLAARLIQALERELGSDPPRLAHALLVFQHAKQLLEQEGGDPRLILAAAVMLQFISDDPANLKKIADRPCVLADSGPAERILQPAGLQRDTIRAICQLIRTYRTMADRNTTELKVISDADRLAQLTHDGRGTAPVDLEDMIQRDLHTTAGRERARALFSGPSGSSGGSRVES